LQILVVNYLSTNMA